MISTIDAVIILAYLALVVIIGSWVGRNNKTQNDYFLAGRSMPWIPVALSVAATMISANSIIGGPGWAYNGGMYPFMVNVTVPLAVVVALSISMPVFYSLKVTSIYEYMGLRLGKYSRALTILQFFINSIITVSSMIFVPVLILQAMTGWPPHYIIPLVVFTALIYTIIGGIKAVIWTDAIQMIVVIGATLFVIATAFGGLDTSLSETIAIAHNAGKLNTLNFTWDFTKGETFWVSLLGGTVMWIRYFCFDQAQVQRVLTASSIKSAKSSLVVSSFIMNIIYFVMLIIGVLLYLYYDGREFKASNDIMIDFILNELPIGAIGLIIAGVFAAAMSSVDSLLNSMVVVFCKDIYEPYRRMKTGKNEEMTLQLTWVITAIIGVITVVVVYFGFNGSVKSVLNVVGSYISYFSGPACGAFLLAMFTKRANDKGVALGVIIGAIAVFFVSTTFKVNWLWNPLVGMITAFSFGFILSSVFASSSNEDKKAFTAQGMREKLIAEGTTEKELLPFAFGKQELVVLIFFFLQYVVLFAMQK